MHFKLSYFFTSKGATDLLVFMTWGGALVSIVTAIFLRIPALNSLAQAAVPLLFILTALVAVPNISRRMRITDVLLYLGIAVVYIFQYILFPKNSEQLDEHALRFFFSCLPLFYVGLAIDFEKYEKPLYYISIACLAWAYFYSLLYKQQDVVGYSGDLDDLKQYASMHLAYTYLPHVLYLIYFSFKKFNVINILLSIAGVFLIFSYGSRGPVLCIIVYIVGLILFLRKLKHPVLVWITAGIAFILFYIYVEQIMLYLQLFLEELGMRTRIADKYLGEELGDSSGRNEFVQILMPVIRSGGLWGYGICGSWQFIGSYPHNLLLDLWVSFGMFPGSIVFMAILFIIIKGFHGCSSDQEKAFLFLLMVRGFIMLFFSYNYLENGFLFMLLGYSVHLWRRRYLGNAAKSDRGPINNRLIIAK